MKGESALATQLVLRENVMGIFSGLKNFLFGDSASTETTETTGFKDEIASVEDAFFYDIYDDDDDYDYDYDHYYDEDCECDYCEEYDYY